MQLNPGKRKNFSLNSTKHIAICFVVCFLTVFIISSCKKKSVPELNITAFQLDIEDATTVPDLTTASQLTRDVLQPLGATSGATLEKRYVTEYGAGSYNGSSWGNAWAATNLRTGIHAISDTSANKVYLVMIAGGTYKPNYANPGNRGDSFSMKNHVAIMGGFQTGGGWARTGTTIFSGDIGAVGNNTDNSYHVFSHVSSPTLNNAHLYGVTITSGNASSSLNPANQGGGMYNRSTSPVLTDVTFSGNMARSEGGGLYNESSSPIINNTVFTSNNAGSHGGGFANFNSSPVLNNTVFTGNTTATSGGGMYNGESSPVIIGAVFRGNNAANGGGMFNNNDAAFGPLIVNTIFFNNTVTGTGPAIAVNLGGSSAENIRIAGSVLGIGLTRPTDAIVNVGTGIAPNITYYSLANGAVNFGADATVVGGFTYPTIGAGSSAIDIGLYVRRSGTTYYFSEDESTWYTGFTSTGAGGLVTVETPPGNATDLTATDIAGNARNGRPDAGVYEVR